MNTEILPRSPGSKGCVSAFEASVGANLPSFQFVCLFEAAVAASKLQRCSKMHHAGVKVRLLHFNQFADELGAAAASVCLRSV